MKIALAQLNYHIGNFAGNTAKIIEAIQKAHQQNVDLVIFSELSICGYPPLDLLEKKDFIEQNEISIHSIASVCTDIAAIVGGPSINHSRKGKRLFNSAFFLERGKVQSIHHKTLLPTYDIFAQYKYFESNTEFKVVHFKGRKIAITICEDLWDMEKLIQQKPDFIINIAASPFSYIDEDERKNVLINNARKYQLPLFFVNQVGAQTELIFDGGSMVINSKGKIIDKLNYFEEDFKIFDLDEIQTKKIKINHEYSPTVSEQAGHQSTIKKINNALVLGIKDYFEKMSFKQAVVGLSGGLDSAVTLVLAARALGNKNVRVLLMPSKYSSEHSITDAVKLTNNLKIKYDIISIEPIVESFDKSLSPIFKDLSPGITEENIQARIRGILLMAISNKFGSILLNTSNKSEAAVGYGTLYGDMIGGLSVLGDVYKTDVFKLAKFINKDKEIIPDNTITKPPSAELRPDQKDTDTLPDYKILDKILYHYIELKQSAQEIINEELGNKQNIDKILQMVNTNEYKRFQAPPVLRISLNAFGKRMPLVAKY